ncbi:toll-like receptor 5 [Pelobates fuscus]|uniref:toll-like receptor 5 n=1 Tax=Pelobates fuscus TaxID=191477 RepID=UPI002FE492B8
MALPFVILLRLCCLASLPFLSYTSRCTSFLAKSRLVQSCQAQGLQAIPSDIPPETQVLLLNFNNIESVTQHAFPDLQFLQALSLGAQKTVGSFIVGEDAFHHLPNLTSLDLGGNRNLILHPKAFRGLSRLEILLLDSNGLNESVLESSLLMELPSLQKIDLSFNQIHRLRPDPSFLQLSSISSILLKFNKISALCGDDLQYLQGRRIKLLDLSSNPLKYDNLSCTNPFKNITLGILDISSMAWDVKKVENFFKTISGTQVENITMRYNALLGSGFGFKNLKDPSKDTFSGLNSSNIHILDLSNGFISHLAPQLFTGLSELLSLDLSSNKISGLSPGAFLGMGKLVSLNLSNNFLGEILSNSVKDLESTSLRALDLSSNHIGVIQYGSLDVLASLESLNIRNNALTRIPPVKLPRATLVILRQNRIADTFGLATFCPLVTFLDISSNRLTDVRSLWDILELRNLQYLLLGRNQLSHCSPVVAGKHTRMSGLLFLDMSNNAMGTVWKSGQCGDIFMGLEQLHTLNLSKNDLTSLPENLFRGLLSLRTLDLSQNQLTRIQSGLFLGLGTMKSLNLGSNTLITLSDSNLEPLSSLKTIDLSEITFVCHCDLGNLFDWLLANNVTVHFGANTISCIQATPNVSDTSLINFLSNC